MAKFLVVGYIEVALPFYGVTAFFRVGLNRVFFGLAALCKRESRASIKGQTVVSVLRMCVVSIRETEYDERTDQGPCHT